MEESHIQDTASACHLAYLERYEVSGRKKILQMKHIVKEYAQVEMNTAENFICD